MDSAGSLELLALPAGMAVSTNRKANLACAIRKRSMPASGTSTYTDPDDYQANVRGARVELVLACRGDFKARLTWVELRDLHVLRSQESLPRIAYVALAPERLFVAFPTHNDPPPIWGGVKVKS